MFENIKLHEFNSRLFNNKSAKIISDLLILKSLNKTLNVALSGGNTPIPILSDLLKTNTQWDKISFFQVDERFVNEFSDGSNFKSLKECFYNKINSDFFPMISDYISIDNSVFNYNKIIEEIVPKSTNGIPEFDLILLGVGFDGHTASLFKGHNEQRDISNVHKVFIKENQYPVRITMNFSLINNSKKTVLLVKGNERSSMIKNMMKNPDNYTEFPIMKILKNSKKLIIILEK